MRLRRARDRNDPRLLGQQPGERDLRGSRFLLRCDLADHIDQGLVCLAGLGRKARLVGENRCCRTSSSRRSVPVRNPLPRGAKGHEADTELLKSRQNFRFRLPPPERVFVLQRGDWLHRVSARIVATPASDRPKWRTLPCGSDLSPLLPHLRSARWDRRGADRKGRSRRSGGAGARLPPPA